MLIAVAAVVAGVYIYMLREYGGKEIFYFNDALNTFYSDSERGNPLQPHRLLFPISSNGFLYASSHRQDNTYHGLCYASRGALAGKRNSSMCPPHEESIRRPIAP